MLAGNDGSEAMAVRWMSVLAWLLLVPAIMLTAFLAVAQNGALYGVLQDRNGVTEAVTGISDAERYRLNASLAAYIRGDKAELDDWATVFGVEQAAFNETERAHMVDVRNLFALACRACVGLWIGGVAAMIVPLLRRENVLKSYFVALSAWAAVLVTTVIWAVADFTRAFTWFHEILFANDLWILNPATDLMIRMLPEAFFAEIAAIAVVAMIAAVAVAGGIAWAIERWRAMD